MNGSMLLEDRLVAQVRGERPLAFLQATTTQDVEALRPGEGALTCLLDGKGRIQAEMRISVLTHDLCLLDAEPAAREGVTGWLARVAPLSGCEVQDLSEHWRAYALRGEQVAEALGSVGDLPKREHHHAEHDGAIVVRVEWGGGGFDVLAPYPLDLDLSPLEWELLEAARIADGRPRFGVDVTPELIPNETPLLDRAVALAKGCYPGQETVAKVRNLGRPRRGIAVLEGSAPMRAGDEVSDGERTVGTVTSAARSDDVHLAMALVRAEALTRDELLVGGAAVRVRKA